MLGSTLIINPKGCMFYTSHKLRPTVNIAIPTIPTNKRLQSQADNTKVLIIIDITKLIYTFVYMVFDVLYCTYGLLLINKKDSDYDSKDKRTGTSKDINKLFTMAPVHKGIIFRDYIIGQNNSWQYR